MMRGLAIAIVTFVLAGCALDNIWSNDEVVGTWRATELDATLVFHADGTYEATDVPDGRDASSCDPQSFKTRDYAGTWYKTDVGDFVAVDYWDQIWKGRTAKGQLTLSLVWCEGTTPTAVVFVKEQ